MRALDAAVDDRDLDARARCAAPCPFAVELAQRGGADELLARVVEEWLGPGRDELVGHVLACLDRAAAAGGVRRHDLEDVGDEAQLAVGQVAHLRHAVDQLPERRLSVSVELQRPRH